MTFGLLAFAIVAPAFSSGSDWLAQCAANKPACIGYAAGATDQFEFFQCILGAKLVCLPEDITSGEVVDIATRFLIAHPPDGNVSAATVIVEALKVSYPCPGA